MLSIINQSDKPCPNLSAIKIQSDICQVKYPIFCVCANSNTAKYHQKQQLQAGWEIRQRFSIT